MRFPSVQAFFCCFFCFVFVFIICEVQPLGSVVTLTTDQKVLRLTPGSAMGIEILQFFNYFALYRQIKILFKRK